jgi:hypothetical protein
MLGLRRSEIKSLTGAVSKEVLADWGSGGTAMSPCSKPVVARNAWATMAKVVCRYQPCSPRTWYWSRPAHRRASWSDPSARISASATDTSVGRGVSSVARQSNKPTSGDLLLDEGATDASFRHQGHGRAEPLPTRPRTSRPSRSLGMADTTGHRAMPSTRKCASPPTPGRGLTVTARLMEQKAHTGLLPRRASPETLGRLRSRLSPKAIPMGVPFVGIGRPCPGRVPPS